jgi:hypothetical protein
MNSWWTSAAVGAAVFVGTAGNRPAMVLTDDAVPQTFIPWMTLRGDGVDFAPVIAKYGDPHEPLRPYLTRSGTRVLSVYPYAAGWVALPFSAPQFWWMDRTAPGWDAEGAGLLDGLSRVGKRTSAAIVAATAVLLHRLLVAWGFGGWSILATLVAVFGSNLWAVASQATWQHGPAALCLTAALLALSPPGERRPGGRRLFVAGLFAGLLTAVRLQAFPLSAALAAIALFRFRSWTFFVAPTILAVALVGWNMATFDHPLGAQTRLVARMQETHHTSWGDPRRMLEGLAGTLASPNRGLLAFSPWCLTLACVVFARSLDSRAKIMAGGLAAFWVVIGVYPVWWAGHCFGPRYWTEAMPLFAAPLAWTFRWSWRRSAAVFGLLTVACSWSVGVQAVGAVCYPSTWNMEPANVDVAHERLWDWRDTEVSRCLTEGPFRAGR